jgi:hypothetical protein
MIISHSLGLSGKVNMHGQSLSFAIQLLFFFENEIGLNIWTILGCFFNMGQHCHFFLFLGLGPPRYFQWLFWNQCHISNTIASLTK